uniref:Uncharacterized protein n=1 Tax=Chromera velia CCMP2878 TaxID=1169474 RepID=A0A0G4IEM8_9ALVE|eukprot:Cvel_13678.t1-p1 / transcript=Cvel_13678.t1 / gene=Cvel_13678 / organism=Chromera_velia_CCMP2878 / gene_product=hypothetical protein / transcript_product=hypothetical protein / location=Cvel_scaffold944:46569-59285(-) / protein_length=402 / sequence_SO=supercontig / SO=protein_coding / is_pseudo=false
MQGDGHPARQWRRSQTHIDGERSYRVAVFEGDRRNDFFRCANYLARLQTWDGQQYRRLWHNSWDYARALCTVMGAKYFNTWEHELQTALACRPYVKQHCGRSLDMETVMEVGDSDLRRLFKKSVFLTEQMVQCVLHGLLCAWHWVPAQEGCVAQGCKTGKLPGLAGQHGENRGEGERLFPCFQEEDTNCEGRTVESAYDPPISEEVLSEARRLGTKGEGKVILSQKTAFARVEEERKEKQKQVMLQWQQTLLEASRKKREKEEASDASSDEDRQGNAGMAKKVLWGIVRHMRVNSLAERRPRLAVILAACPCGLRCVRGGRDLVPLWQGGGGPGGGGLILRVCIDLSGSLLFFEDFLGALLPESLKDGLYPPTLWSTLLFSRQAGPGVLGCSSGRRGTSASS